jgi:hypothetical protein
MKRRLAYYSARLFLLSAQFFLYKYIVAYCDPPQFRRFVYISTLVSLFGLTDFGFSIAAQRLASIRDISRDSSRDLVVSGRLSIVLACVFSILSSFFYFRLDYGSLSNFSLVLFIAFAASIFALNVAFLVASSLCRIAFSSPTHGYEASIVMSSGPMIALIALAIGQSLDMRELQNASAAFAIGSGAAFTLTIIYILRSCSQILCLFRSFSELSVFAGFRPGSQSLHDWSIGAMGMLTLQSDMVIVLLLKSPNLTSYFLVVKILSVFAFLSSISLPRVFSAFAEDPASDSMAMLLRGYSLKSKIFPFLAFGCTMLYLYMMKQVSPAAVLVAFTLSAVLYLRIMTDLFSCVLQASGRVRELASYLPFQLVVTVVCGVFLGKQINSVGVAFAQLAGFSLIAYPWLSRKFKSLLYSSQ